MTENQKLGLIDFMIPESMPYWMQQVHRERSEKRAKIREINQIFASSDMNKMQDIENLAHSIFING